MNQQQMQPKKKFNPLILLPVGIGLVIAALVLCAAGFAVYAIFFYEADVPEEVGGPGPTPTFEIVQFDSDSQGGGEDNAVQNEPTPAPAPAEGEVAQSEQPGEGETEQPAQPAAPDGGETTNGEAPSEPEPPASEAAPVTPIINTAPVTMSSPDYGMQVFLFWQDEIADRDLKLVEDAGFTWVKQEFAWREIEGAGKGVFDWARTDRIMDQIDSHGLKVIVRLGVQPQWAGGGFPEVGPPNNLQDFADYVRAVATRYKGRIDAYQIWNEPNLSREWGERPPNAAEYTEMLRVSYEAIKEVDPYPIVISAGMAPTTRNDDVARPDIFFIQEMYDAGAAAYFDALGAHAPGYASPPETDPADIARTPGLANPGDFENNVPEELRRVYGFRHVEDVRQVMVNNGDEAKQIVLLEFGWTVDPRPDSPYNWHAVTPEEQDVYFQRAYAYAKENWRPWIGVMSLIYIANPRWTLDDEQTYWSIVYPTYPEFTPAPAYFGLQQMPKD